MHNRQVDTVEAKRFLEALFGQKRQGYVEFKYLSRDGLRPGSRFVGPGEAWPWPELQAVQDDGRNVLVGVCPRHKPKEGRDAIASARALWIDLIAWRGGLSKDEALSRIERLDATIKPSIVVGSGNGYQVYWLLESEVVLQLPRGCACDNGGVDRSYVDDLNKRLSHLTDPGKRAIYHVSEVMPSAYGVRYATRLPGTWDFINPGNPQLCKIVIFEPERRYGLETLDKAIPSLSELSPTHPNGSGMRYVGQIPL